MKTGRPRIFKEKQVRITFNCDEALKNNFAECCDYTETSISRELRLFMKKFVEKHSKKVGKK